MTRRRVALVLVLVFVAAIGLDASRGPDHQFASKAAIAALHVYQRTLSPVFEKCGLRCRFTPSCGRYAELSLRRHGLMAGGWQTLKRIARCGPWTPAGTIDLPR